MPSIYSSRFLAVVVLYFLKIDVNHIVLRAATFRRATTACDLDHTIPWHLGGQTCECDLGPVCRHDHKTKQAPRWALTQTEPGHMTWTTPSGRTYTTGPTSYPD